MTSGIYLIQNRCNGKVYVGRSKNIEQRITQHTSSYSSQECLIDRTIQEKGPGSFYWSILEISEGSRRSLLERERFWIQFYDAVDPLRGYNQPHSRPYLRTEETKEKVRQSVRQARLGSHHSEEAKEKIRRAVRKARLGSHHSEEAKEKIRQSALRRASSLENHLRHRHPGYRIKTLCILTDIFRGTSDEVEEIFQAAGESGAELREIYEDFLELSLTFQPYVTSSS